MVFIGKKELISKKVASTIIMELRTMDAIRAPILTFVVVASGVIVSVTSTVFFAHSVSVKEGCTSTNSAAGCFELQYEQNKESVTISFPQLIQFFILFLLFISGVCCCFI